MRHSTPKLNRYAVCLSCTLSVAHVPLGLGNDAMEDGLFALECGNYEEAFLIFQTEATFGDAKAHYLLGTLYQMGKGVQQDEDEAFRQFHKAAQEGVLEAQYQVGIMYLQGIGVNADDDEALRWLWSAADRGFPQATETLEYVLYNDFTYGC